MARKVTKSVRLYEVNCSVAIMEKGCIEEKEFIYAGIPSKKEIEKSIEAFYEGEDAKLISYNTKRNTLKYNIDPDLLYNFLREHGELIL